MRPIVDTPASWFNSEATDVSGDGAVVVGWGSVGEDGWRSFRWTEVGGLQELAAPPGVSNPLRSGRALAVSDNGAVIVGAGGGLEAFRWTAASGMHRLYDALLAAGVDPSASGWTRLNEATDVSTEQTDRSSWATVTEVPFARSCRPASTATRRSTAS